MLAGIILAIHWYFIF